MWHWLACQNNKQDNHYCETSWTLSKMVYRLCNVDKLSITTYMWFEANIKLQESHTDIFNAFHILIYFRQRDISIIFKACSSCMSSTHQAPTTMHFLLQPSEDEWLGDKRSWCAMLGWGPQQLTDSSHCLKLMQMWWCFPLSLMLCTYFIHHCHNGQDQALMSDWEVRENAKPNLPVHLHLTWLDLYHAHSIE